MVPQHTSLASYDLSRLGLFPLPNVVLFPSQLLSLHVFEPRYRRLINDVIEQKLVFGIPRLKPGHDVDYHGAPPLFDVCGVGKVAEHSRLPDGRYNVVVQGLGRVRLLDELTSEPYRVARAELIAEVGTASPLVAEALRSELSKLLRRIGPHVAGPAKDLEAKLRGVRELGECADLVAGSLIENTDDRQALLEERDAAKRMTWLIAHVHGLCARLPGPHGAAQARHLN